MTDAFAAAGPLNCESCYGTLTIGEVSLHTPAWCCTDLSDLWNTPPQRGSNRLIPGRQGTKPYKRRLNESHFSLPMIISGFCDQEGVSYFDLGLSFEEGLEANVAFLQNNVALPNPDTINSTREATLTLPSGNVRKSDVNVLGLLAGKLVPGSLLRATLEIVDSAALLLVGGENFV